MAKLKWIRKNFEPTVIKNGKVEYAIYSDDNGWSANFLANSAGEHTRVLHTGDLVDCLAACQKHHDEREQESCMREAYPLLLDAAKAAQHWWSCEKPVDFSRDVAGKLDAALKAAGVELP